MLTGPSFAADIARGLPTALTLATADEATGRDLQHRLATPVLRLYLGTDMTGAELGGALKNVVALAAGMAIGAGFGESARAAIITRGFAEMMRLRHRRRRPPPDALEACPASATSTLTANSEKSRNYLTGLELGRGLPLVPRPHRRGHRHRPRRRPPGRPARHRHAARPHRRRASPRARSAWPRPSGELLARPLEGRVADCPAPQAWVSTSAMRYWLFKSEPEAWGWDDQVARGDGGQEWDGVRNFQARNHMREMRKGDLGFFYHSGAAKAVVGIVEVTAEAHPDSTADDPSWECVDIRAVRPLPNSVTLATCKADPRLADMVLVNNSRLSVQPVTAEESATVSALGGL